MKAMNRVAGALLRASVVSATIVAMLRNVASVVTKAAKQSSRLALLAASCGALLASALAVAPAARAQQQSQSNQQPQKQLEEITVTGTRIQSRDNTSNSPIVTINASQFQEQNGINFESYLNKLPQYNPAASPTTTQGDVQITPVNSVGIASISLRGFGPNRSLVLIDGKRTVPVNALMVTDVNSIPSALVQRVETITGGASAVYGADAVSGVTNFILKDNFEGFEVNSQYGVSATGDGTERDISATFGTNSANGKGNIAIGVEHYQRDAASRGKNPFYQQRYQDPYAPGYFFFLQGTSNLSCQFNCPSQAAVDAVFGVNPNDPTAPQVLNWAGFNIFKTYTFNYNGTVFVPSSVAGLAKFAGNGPRFTFYPSRQIDGSIPNPSPNTQEIAGLKWVNPQAYTSAPQERYSLFLTGHYDLGDRLSMYTRATWAQSTTRTLLFGTNAISGWETQVSYDPNTDSPILPNLPTNELAAAIADPTNPLYANPSFIGPGQPGAGHPVPVEVAALLNNRVQFPFGAPNPTAAWLPGWNPDTSLPPRSTINTNTTWQVQTGLNFKMFTDWTGEIYVSHGESQTYNNANGNLSLERFRELVNQPDWGQGATITGNSTTDQGAILGQQLGAAAATPTRPGFGVATVHCTSGFYNTFFGGDAALSQDCYNAINATLQTRTYIKQSIVEMNLQGPLANIKPGQIRGAFGYQHREDYANFVPDILQSEYSFADQVIGVYPTGYMDASTAADDIYFETNIPLISNKKGFRRLELNLGARESHPRYTKNESTWKSLFNWRINDWFMLRGGFNRATRAPNIGELFLNRQEIFTGGATYGDPCSVLSTAPFGAGGAAQDFAYTTGNSATNALGRYASGQTAAGANSAALICAALMGGLNGMPANATLSLNANGTLNVAAGSGAAQYYDASGASSGGASPFAWVDQIGNPNLNPETANTWTFGFVMNSPFKKPLLSGITFTLDSYRIDLNNAIELESLDVAAYNCFGAVQVTNVGQALAQAATPACQLTPRDPVSGAPLSTTISYDNQATIKTEGMDIALNWRLNFADVGSRIKGGLAFNLMGTYLDYYRTKTSPAVFDPWTDWKGSLGPSLQGTNGGAYDYRLFNTLTYFRNSWSVSMRWHSLPSVWTAGYATQQAIKENNASVAAGGPGITLSYIPSTEIKTPSYRSFDLSFNYNINKISIRGGVTNVLNTAPPNVGTTAGYPIGMNLNSVCGSAPGCENPTSYSLQSTGGFNGGYYDTLGRQYFVGFKFTF